MHDFKIYSSASSKLLGNNSLQKRVEFQRILYLFQHFLTLYLSLTFNLNYFLILFIFYPRGH